jgi:hypothetical protein
LRTIFSLLLRRLEDRQDDQSLNFIAWYFSNNEKKPSSCFRLIFKFEKYEFPIKNKVLINFKNKIFSESTNNKKERNETKRRRNKRIQKIFIQCKKTNSKA